MKRYTRLGPDGRPYESALPGTLGGHRRLKTYGRLDCPSARRWLAKGHYVKQRVFFADEAAALTAGYRPCAVCLPERYAAWKQTRATRSRASARGNEIGQRGRTGMPTTDESERTGPARTGRLDASAQSLPEAADIQGRVAVLDWARLAADLDARGFAVGAPVLTAAECQALVELYGDETRFRSRIDMARYRFGQGEYKYLAYPLPPLVQALRAAFYPHLARTANRWARRLGQAGDFPEQLATFLSQCHAAGQTKPTPLLLHYTAEGYNCLHQDLYGAVAFPLQVIVMLSRRERDYSGGEVLLLEQRPRAQSCGEAVALEQGAALILTTRHRPVAGSRGAYRVSLRHGVSRVRSGERYTLGLIFHDAQ